MTDFILAILNLIGMGINFWGVVKMFLASPNLNPPNFYLFSGTKEEYDAITNYAKNNQSFRRGMGILAIGFLIQFLATMAAALRSYPFHIQDKSSISNSQQESPKKIFPHNYE